MIRASNNDAEALQGLQEQFKLSERQAQAILDMRLRRLTGLERDKIESEYQELLKYIDELRAILADEEKLLQIIREELIEIRDKYGDERRTEIVAGGLEDLEDEDLIDEENIVITLSSNNYIKRLPASTYRAQHRGGRGIQGMNTLDEDFVSQMVTTSTHDNVLFFTNKGRVYKVKGYEIPELSRQSKGIPIVNVIDLDKDESISTMIAVKNLEREDAYIVFATKHGLIKRSNLSHFSRINKNGKIAINFREEDELIAVRLTDGNKQLIIGTKHASLIRFEENKLRPLGRTAAGVKGISLREGDEVIGLDVIESNDEHEVLVVTENGYGKRTKESEYRISNRGGKGIKTATITEKNGNLVCITTVNGNEDIMIVTDHGVIIRLDVAEFSQNGRSAQGVRLIRLDEGQFVATVAKVEKEEEVMDEDKEPGEVIAEQGADLTEVAKESIDETIEVEDGHVMGTVDVSEQNLLERSEFESIYNDSEE